LAKKTVSVQTRSMLHFSSWKHMHPKVSIAYFLPADTESDGELERKYAAGVMAAICRRWPFARFDIFGGRKERDNEQWPDDLPADFVSPEASDPQEIAEAIRQNDCRIAVCHCRREEPAAAADLAGIPVVFPEQILAGDLSEMCHPESIEQSAAERVAGYVCRVVSEADELLDVVDADGRVLGAAPRCRIHGNNRWLHRVVHLLVLDSGGRLLLQKRSMNKSVAPGRWDTSVGGHVDCGEDVETALCREASEELGFLPRNPLFAYQYIHSNMHESELVFTFTCTHDGPFRHNPEEIDAVAFWHPAEISASLGKGIFSDNFEDEYRRYLRWLENGD